MHYNPLRQYRESHDLSQQELADRLGCSRQMVSHLERGDRDFTLDMALKIEKELGINRAVILPKLAA